jgi:hypothetical protein
MTCAFCKTYFDPSSGECPTCKATVEDIIEEQYKIDESNDLENE